MLLSDKSSESRIFHNELAKHPNIKLIKSTSDALLWRYLDCLKLTRLIAKFYFKRMSKIKGFVIFLVQRWKIRFFYQLFSCGV